MLDFTSALYLGLRHPTWSLRPWSQFTTGIPAALRAPCIAQEVAQSIAGLQGCESGTLGTSTLHLFWDLFGMLAEQPVAIYVDEGAYPIARWGAERAAARGVPARSFAHHDPQALRRMLRQDAPRQLRPIVVADGFCPGCGNEAPLAAYLVCVREFNGRLVLDDTQALGILGHSPNVKAPYGRGGGGMLPWSNIGGPHVLVVSSLAKGFGVPVAALSGNASAVHEFEAASKTRVHCSPPSIAVLHAAENALRKNRDEGDAIRTRLAHLVQFFRQRLNEQDLAATESLFPVQTLNLSPDWLVFETHRRLLQKGIRGVLHRAPQSGGARLSFLITARHTFQELDWALKTISRVVRTAARPVLAWR